VQCAEPLTHWLPIKILKKLSRVLGTIQAVGALPMKSRLSNLASAALASAALVAFASGARATPVYTLDATNLSDGGTISGSIFFTPYGFIDDSSPGFTVSTGLYPYSDVTFSNANASLSNSGGISVWDFFVSGTYSPMLQLEFLGNPLTGPATLVTGIGGPSFICGGSGDYLCGGTALDYLTTGAFTSGAFNPVANDVTPLPSTWTMLIAGFIGLFSFVAFGGKKRNAAALASV
jgi:hypothetical protein